MRLNSWIKGKPTRNKQSEDGSFTHFIVQDVILHVLVLTLLHLGVVVKVKPVAAECARGLAPVAHLISTGFLSAFEASFFKLFPEERVAGILLCRRWAGKVPVFVLPVAGRSSWDRRVRAKAGTEG